MVFLSRVYSEDVSEWGKLAACFAAFALVFLLVANSFTLNKTSLETPLTHMQAEHEISRGHLFSQISTHCEWFGDFCIIVEEEQPKGSNWCDNVGWDSPICPFSP